LDENDRQKIRNNKVKFRKNNSKNSNSRNSPKSNTIWIALITVISFVTSASLSVISSDVLEKVDLYVSFLLLLFIILVNIIADIIGTAVTAADETPFHSMASRKIYGARRAIRLIRNADRVANVCNDVLGDICGVISGAAGAYVVVRIVGSSSGYSIVELVITGCIASFTVGGKALGKIIAISNSNYIIYKFSVIIQFISDIFYRKRKKQKNKQKSNKKHNNNESKVLGK